MISRIKFFTPFGKQLKNDNLDKNVKTPGYCICDDLYYKKEKEKCICKYKRHPLNPDFQVFLSFKIGVLENELNTNPLKN